MKFNYPQSIPCAFDNFPVALDIRLGNLAASIVDGCSLGSKFKLMQTPLSGVAQGEYVAGNELPECRKIYSDTGYDDNFTIKISFFGHGTFYKFTGTDKNLMFEVYKCIALETNKQKEIVFGSSFSCETLIDSSSDIDSIFNYKKSSWGFIDDADYNESNGTIAIGGDVIFLKDGKSITLNSLYGSQITITVVNGIVTIL